MSNWMLDAICGRIDPALWFPEQETDAGYAKAIAYCRICPVMQTCLTAALRDEAGKRASNRHGVRAGLTPHQRGALEFDLQHGTNSCYVNDLCRCQPCTSAATVARRPKTALAA